MATTLGSRPGSTGSGPAHHASLTASPTLTNPDMILPDYDRSPSPVRLDSNRPQSPLTIWKNAQSLGAPDNTINNMLYDQANQQFTGFASAAPATPIIYGNGTMLSDIGEVTEVESTPGKPSPPRERHIPARVSPYGTKDRDSESDAALRSSPTMGQGGCISAIKKRAKEQAAQRERRSSTGSDSTVTDHHDQANLFEDFSDAISLSGDSVFQGDDEDSIASSYVDESDINGGSDMQSSIPVSLSYESRQKYSTAQLSRRAEHILANAKRRLTNMEDNLTRARSSLASVTNYSPGSNSSTPSPPIARATSALFTSTTSPLSPSLSGHSRKGSDNSLRIGLPIKVYPQRSSSVIGVTSARHYPLAVSKSADQLNGQYQRASYIVREAQISLEPLSEDETSQLSSRAQLGTTYRHSTITSPTFAVVPERGLSRSASVTQMKDLKDQVNDLKGKISSLREKARADSLKRRSVQSLRTPSPFTYSQTGQWSGASDSTLDPDTKSLGDHDKPDRLSDDAASVGKDSAVNIGDLGDEDASSVYSLDNVGQTRQDQVGELDRDSAAALRADGFVHVEDDEDMFTENGDVDEEDLDEVFDTVSEGGDSLYHEAVQHQLSHEDREDAFDYEHFFLHSAMGTISHRMTRRGSESSYTSDGSLETTRGPVPEYDKKPPQRSRRGSDASVSSFESFATAEEALSGRLSADSSRNFDSLDDLPEESNPPSTFYTETMARPQATKRTLVNRIGSPTHVISGRPSPDSQWRGESMYSVIQRTTSKTGMTKTHRPAMSSFDSTGTTRSFPLVNRSRQTSSSGLMTPDGGSPDPAAGSSTSSRMSDPTLASPETRNGETGKPGHADHHGHKHNHSLQSISSTASLMQENGTTAVIQTLPRDDQFLVERTVASLGRCVLGLTESGRASAEGRMYRRRIDAARRILEGLERV